MIAIRDLRPCLSLHRCALPQRGQARGRHGGVSRSLGALPLNPEACRLVFPEVIAAAHRFQRKRSDPYGSLRPLTNPQRGMGRCVTSPFSIRFGGVYVKSAFFGSKRLCLRRKMNSRQSGNPCRAAEIPLGFSVCPQGRLPTAQIGNLRRGTLGANFRSFPYR